MSTTDVAAWWGAIVSTLAIVWDIIKWSRSGPCINVRASPNMIVIGGSPLLGDDKKYVSVEVINTGDQKTTITHMVVSYFSSLWTLLRGNADKDFFIATPALTAVSLPHGIAPGERWSGSLIQDQEIERLSRSGWLYVGVFHTSAKKAVLHRIVIPQKSAGLDRASERGASSVS